MTVDARAGQSEEVLDHPASWAVSGAFLKLAIPSILVGIVAVEIALHLLVPDQVLRAYAVLAFGMPALLAWALMAGGRNTAAFWVLGVGVWVYVTASSTIFGGVSSTTIIIYPLIIHLSGWLFGARVGSLVAVLTATATLAMLLGQTNGWLPPSPPTPPALRWLIECTVFILTAFLISYYVKWYRDRLEAVRKLGTELEQVTADLRLSAADLNHAQAVAHIGSWVYDIAGGELRPSAEACRILGLPEGLSGGHPGSRDAHLAQVHPDDRAVVERARQAALAAGPAFDIEHRILSGATVRWVSQKAAIESAADGTALRAIGTVHDITERRRAESGLRASEQKFAKAFQASPDLMAITRRSDNRYLDVNEAFEHTTGHARDDVVGRTSLEIDLWFNADERDGLTAILNQEGRVRKAEVGLRKKAGAAIACEMSLEIIEIEGVQCVLSVTQDVTQRKAVAQALHDSEERFRGLTALSSDWYWEQDENLRFTMISAGIAKGSDIEAAAHLGKTRWELPYANLSPDTIAAHDAVLAARRPFRDFVITRPGRDGKLHIGLLSGEPVFDRDGRFRGYRGVGRDITQTKRNSDLMAAEKLLLERLANSAPLPDLLRALCTSIEAIFAMGARCSVLLSDEAGRCLRLGAAPSLPEAYNQATDGIIIGPGMGSCGTSAHTGQPAIAADLLTDPNWDEFRSVALEHGLRACWSFPIIGAHKVLGTFAIYFPHSCAPDDADFQTMERILDLSRIAIERSREQRQILELNADLEQRVERRTAELQSSVAALESFSYSVAHDLRAPLRAIDGYTSIVLLDHGTSLPEEGRQMLRRASDSVRNLAVLIEGLLNLSRVSRTPATLQAVDMQALVLAVAEEVGSSRPGKVRLEVSPLPPAVGDPALLRQVWRNLIDNAAKFSAQQETPLIEIGALPGEEPAYYVRDHGVGFDMAYESRLFGVFERLHAPGQFEGNGVGLAIVKRIIEHHRGRVWASSTPGEGATFYFSLPADTPAGNR